MDNLLLLRQQLLALRATVDASLTALCDGAGRVDEITFDLSCPQCLNVDGDRIQETSAPGTGQRYTCLACGKSWTLEVVANG